MPAKAGVSPPQLDCLAITQKVHDCLRIAISQCRSLDIPLARCTMEHSNWTGDSRYCTEQCERKVSSGPGCSGWGLPPSPFGYLLDAGEFQTLPGIGCFFLRLSPFQSWSTTLTALPPLLPLGTYLIQLPVHSRSPHTQTQRTRTHGLSEA